VVVLPTGTLTFLMTDLVASTRTWESRTPAMREAMVRHDEVVYGSVERHHGVMVETGRAGDSIFAVFRVAKDAATCAVDIQRRFRVIAWPQDLSLDIRIAMHTGEVELRGAHYFGPALNRCARVLALCHGRQILTTQATQQLLIEDPPPGVELTDLGSHRLKDLRRGERIYQLTELDRPERFPPLRAHPEYRSNIPPPLTSFIGRERELAGLRARLLESRLVTLTGVGGVGKTRLARRLAIDVVDVMPGGAWFVELGPLSDPRLVPRTLASALDVEEQRGRPLVDTLIDRCGGPALLLVLDNCEHLLPSCARLVETLLGACPELRVIATSREPLNVAGETIWRVGPLDAVDAARLFVDRARARSAELEPHPSEAAVIAEICARLDGIPLAIELAAARAATLPLPELRRRLESGLALLSGGGPNAPERQRTIEATIDWSYRLLDEAERTLLRRLSVFAGPFTIDAAEAVCADALLPRDAVVEHLLQLVSRSLLQRVDDRYACLQTIRAYGRDKLAAAGESELIRAAHASYYLEVARSRRPGHLAEWLDRVEEERVDLQEALRWCLAADHDMGARFADSLFDFALLRGYAREARFLLEELVKSLPPGSPARSRAMLDAGAFAYTGGDFAAAGTLVRDGLDAARATDDRALLARGLTFDGNIAAAAGDLERAQASLDESRAIARALGDERREAEALHHLGTLALVRGDAAGARARYTESLDVRARLGRLDEAGTTFTLRAFTAILAGDLVGARRDVVDALRLALALRDRRAGWSLDVAACLAALTGDPSRSLRLAGAARAVFDSTGHRPPAAWQRFIEPLVAGARLAMGAAADETFAAGAAPARRSSVVHTRGDGTFALRLEPGASREVSVTFAGTRLLSRATAAAEGVAAKARVRLRASAARAVVGGRPIVFKGKVATKGTEAGAVAGLPVELQFRYRGAPWSEFRTVEADAHGRFRYPYRFSDDDSRGVRFQFRAYVNGREGWPYEPAYSRPIAVLGR